MSNSCQFPDDENGAVLRQMFDSGDDLSKPRSIDFNVVFATKENASVFRDRLRVEGYDAKIDHSGTVTDFPWDVVVQKEMVPTHFGITSIEEALEAMATPLGGRNDGWGCFEQPE